MAEEIEDESQLAPVRPKLESNAFTHTARQFRRIGKKWGIYKAVGAARAAPCPHCGQPYTGKVKVFIDLLVAFGGGTGGFLVEANGTPPPKLQKDFPEQSEFDEKEILPASGD